MKIKSKSDIIASLSSSEVDQILQDYLVTKLVGRNLIKVDSDNKPKNARVLYRWDLKNDTKIFEVSVSTDKENIE